MAADSLRYRSLLTDTLPYEVPVIFSNSILHASLSAPPAEPKERAALDFFRRAHAPYSKPYCYDISKGGGRNTTLSIIHPAWQIKASNFYEDHAASLLAHCADDRFTLRRPSATASPFREEDPDDEEGRLKLGVAQLASDAGQPDVSHLTTYFAYRKYNLLGKFADSREHQRLEMRFSQRRSLDISKCFYNIYTHSVSWAVKGKDFSKEHANQYTFEGQLDKIFQQINYNETNGIVVGPEFSRIFAEIVLQSVDKLVVERLNEPDVNLIVTRDYDIRRYVDDFYIFANSSLILDCVEKALGIELEKFKLYLNTSKSETHTRPFVSNISLARYEIGSLLREMGRTLKGANLNDDAGEAPNALRVMRSLLSDVRLAIRKNSVSFSNVSGWLLGKYRLIARALLQRAEVEGSASRALCDAVIALIEASIYVCAVDTRVRTTYSLCQLLEMVIDHKAIISAEQYDQMEHAINEGILGILRTLWASRENRTADSVEIYNLLIAGSLVLGGDFTRQTIPAGILSDMANSRVTYFRYISAKFCLLKDQPANQAVLDVLNDAVEAHLRAEGNWQLVAEDHLLLSDFLSAPDIDLGRKRQLFADLVGLNPSKAIIAGLVPHVGFVDWRGLGVKHLLRRKTLRPVYAWG